MKKIIALFTLVVLLVLTGCSSVKEPVYDAKQGSELTVAATVKITNAQTVVAEGEVEVKGTASPTASMATLALLESQKIPHTYDKGIFDGFNGVNSTEESGWLLYVDGALAQVGADDQGIEAGMSIEWKYENYVAAFGFEEEPEL